jgi:chromosome segregation ATPase
MSEERLERIEHQLTQVIQAIATMQQNMTVMQQNITTMQQNMTAMNNRLDRVENRVNSMEGTLLTAMREGFASLQAYQVDLDRDLAANEQKTEDNARRARRLNQRLMRLEQRYDNF